MLSYKCQIRVENVEIGNCLMMTLTFSFEVLTMFQFIVWQSTQNTKMASATLFASFNVATLFFSLCKFETFFKQQENRRASVPLKRILNSLMNFPILSHFSMINDAKSAF